MREKLPFDEFVKEQFSGYSPKVPGHIWENIVAAKRRSKPKGFWMNMLSGSNFLILSLVLLIGGGASYLLLSTSKNNSAPKNIISEKDPSSQTVTTSPGKNSADNSTIVNNTSATEEKKAGKTISDATTDNSDNSSDRNNNNLVTPSLQKKEIKTSVVYNSKTEVTDKQELPVVQNNNDVEKKTVINNSKLFSPFRFNNARDLANAKTLNSKSNIKLPECPTIERNAAGNKMYWELYAGPDRAFENYKSYGDTGSNNYLQKRKASTKFASAFSAGARYTKVFNNGTSIRAGVNYTQVNEKFLYFNPSEIKYVTVITTRVVIRAPGDTIYINDTLQYQQTGTRIKTTYNRYRNIDVPLVIGYELGNGRIHANINAGVVINIYSWYKGDVLDSLYQPVTITTGKGNSIYQYKNNIGVGFLGSVSVYYKMTDKLHLVIEPYFRYNLSPISKQNLNLQQKYNIAGLRAGIRFDLK